MKNISRHFTCLKGTVCAVSRNLISRGHHGGGTLRACRVPHDVGLGSASRACFCAPRRKSHPTDTITQQHHHDPALCSYALVDLSAHSRQIPSLDLIPHIKPAQAILYRLETNRHHARINDPNHGLDFRVEQHLLPPQVNREQDSGRQDAVLVRR